MRIFRLVVLQAVAALVAARDRCPLRFDRTCSDAKLPFCVAINGNGSRQPAHVPALARLVELLGPIPALAGGSSAAGTNLLLESIYVNPHVRYCGHECCNFETQTARISFLLKAVEDIVGFVSLEGFIEFFVRTAGDEVEAVLESMKNDEKVPQAVFDLAGTLFMPLRNYFEFLDLDFVLLLLRDIWRRQGTLIPRLIDFVDYFLENIPPVDNKLLVRELPLDVLGLGDKLDWIATFVAGYEPVDGEVFEAMLKICATADRVFDRKWADIREEQFSDGVSCGEKFKSLYLQFAEERTLRSPRRVDDMVGSVVPIFGPVGLLGGESYEIWKKARQQYIDDPRSVEFEPDFEDLRIGYWGDTKKLAEIEVNLQELYPDDEKTRRFVNLGETTWANMLPSTYSEPGAGPGIDIDGRFVSIGSWTDNQPIQLLKGLGCDKTIQISTATVDTELGFYRENAVGLLGATEEQYEKLFGFGSQNSTSSFTTALEEQDGAMCVDWGDFPFELFERGYNGVFLSNDKCLQDLGALEPDQPHRHSPCGDWLVDR